MNKINQHTKKLLTKVHFHERYENLVNKYNHPPQDRLESPDVTLVTDILNKLGFNDTKFLQAEKYFELEEIIDTTYQIHFALSLIGGRIEFIVSFSSADEFYRCGGNYQFINALLGTNVGYRTPHFTNYKELEEILKQGFEIYSDIKEQIMKK